MTFYRVIMWNYQPLRYVREIDRGAFERISSHRPLHHARTLTPKTIRYIGFETFLRLMETDIDDYLRRLSICRLSEVLFCPLRTAVIMASCTQLVVRKKVGSGSRQTRGRTPDEPTGRLHARSVQISGRLTGTDRDLLSPRTCPDRGPFIRTFSGVSAVNCYCEHAIHRRSPTLLNSPCD